MKISFSDPVFFRLLYILSFFLTFICVVLFAVRKKMSLGQILLTLTTTTLFTVAGSRLFTIPIGQWFDLMSSGSFEGHLSRSAVGGLLFGVAGLFIAMRYFRLNISLVSLYSVITPACFGIMKIGCFLNGCCYGKASDILWGVQYPVCTNIHFHHWAEGLINENNAYSLSVHPVQLYEASLLLVVSYVVWLTLKFWKREWSIMFFSLSLFFAARFIAAFFREPAAMNFLNNDLQSVRVFKLLMIVFMSLSGILLFLNERKYISFEIKTDLPSPVRVIKYTIVLSFAVYLLRGLFTGFEMTAVDMEFVPALFFISIYAFKNASILRQKIVATSFMTVPLFFIFQSLPQDTVRNLRPIRDFYSNVSSYHQVDFGILTGNYKSEVAYKPVEGECGTSYTHEQYKHRMLMSGFGYSYFKKYGKATTIYGINTALGYTREENLTTYAVKNFTLYNIEPYIKMDRPWIGLGFGFEVGNIRLIPIEPQIKSYFNSGTKQLFFLPELSIRIGRRDYLDMRYDYGLQKPTTLPVQTHEFSLGIGFGNKSDYSLRFGVGTGYLEEFAFISTEALLKENFGFNLKYNFDISGIGYGWGALGVNYRFGFNK